MAVTMAAVKIKARVSVGLGKNKSLEKLFNCRVILVNMEISVILGHEKTKIQNIIDYGKIDVFSVRTNIHIKNKTMGHLI